MSDSMKKDMMNLTDNQRIELVNALKTCEELIISQALSFERERELEKRVAELEKTNDALNSRLEKAKDFFYQQEEKINHAETRTKASLARNMQKARDEIYTIGNALHNYALALVEKPTSKLTLLQVNNLQAGLSIVITVLEENGLWNPEQDLKPDLSVPEKVVKPKSPRKPKTKKTEESPAIQMELMVSETNDKPEA